MSRKRLKNRKQEGSGGIVAHGHDTLGLSQRICMYQDWTGQDGDDVGKTRGKTSLEQTQGRFNKGQ